MKYSHNMQMLDNDCGLAVLKSILETLKIRYTKNYDFFNDNISDEGISLYDIQEELLNHGIKSNAYEVDSIEKIESMEYPSILVSVNDGLLHYILSLIHI